MDLKMIMFGTVSAGIGFLAGYFVNKKINDKKYRDRIDELDAYYSAISKYCVEDIKCTREMYTNNENISADRANGILPDEERKKMKENMKKEKNVEKIDYTSYYKEKREEVIEEEDQNEEEGEIITDEYDKNKVKPPQLISIDDAQEIPEWMAKDTLHFYSYNEVLIDDFDNIITNHSDILGDALDEFDFGARDTDVIFVANWGMGILYTIYIYDEEYETEM